MFLLSWRIWKTKCEHWKKNDIPQFLSPLCPQSGSFAMWWCSWERWLIIRCCTASITPVKSWLPWVKPCLRWGLGDSCVKETDWTVHLKTKLFIMNPALGTCSGNESEMYSPWSFFQTCMSFFSSAEHTKIFCEECWWPNSLWSPLTLLPLNAPPPPFTYYGSQLETSNCSFTNIF